MTAQGMLGAALAGDKAPLASTAGALWAPGFTLLLIGAGISMLGYLQGNILGNSRLLYALGRDGLLPAALGRVHPRTRVPHIGVIVHAGVALALALSGDFATLALVSGGSVGLLYLFVCLAAWRLQRFDSRTHEAPMQLPGGPLIPIVGVLAMSVILATPTAQEWIAIGVALSISALIYGASTRVRSSYEAVPIVDGPKAGFVNNANNTPFTATAVEEDLQPTAFARELGIETRETNRCLRLQELLSADDSITRVEFRAIKFDKRYSTRSELATLIGKVVAMDLSKEADAKVLREAQALLRGYDLSTNWDNRSAALAIMTGLPVIVPVYQGKPAGDALAALRQAIATLKTHYGRIDPMWGEVSRFRRGTIDAPTSGRPDVLRDFESDVVPQPDGKFEARKILLSGKYAPLATSPRIRDSPWLMRLDYLGNKKWEKAYVELGSDGQDKTGALWDAIELDNGDIMACGFVRDENQKWDPLLIRTDGDGCIDQGQANCPQVQIIDLMSGAVDVIGEPPISINPNPACTHITIDAPDRSVYTIYSLSGQAVVQGIAADTEVDISHLSAGIYIVKIVDMNGQIYCQKLQKH